MLQAIVGNTFPITPAMLYNDHDSRCPLVVQNICKRRVGNVTRFIYQKRFLHRKWLKPMRPVQAYSPPVDKKIEIYHSAQTYTYLSADLYKRGGKNRRREEKNLLGLPSFGLRGAGSRFFHWAGCRAGTRWSLSLPTLQTILRHGKLFCSRISSAWRPWPLSWFTFHGILWLWICF